MNFLWKGKKNLPSQILFQQLTSKDQQITQAKIDKLYRTAWQKLPNTENDGSKLVKGIQTVALAREVTEKNFPETWWEGQVERYF